MGALAIACGALIVAFGLVTTRHAPSEAQFGTEITCLVGGLVLIFLGVTLRRLDRLARAVGEASHSPEPHPGSHPEPRPEPRTVPPEA